MTVFMSALPSSNSSRCGTGVSWWDARPDAEEASVWWWRCYENVMSQSSQASRSATSMDLAIICGEMSVIKLKSVDLAGCWHVTATFVLVMRTRNLVERSPRLFRWARRVRNRHAEVKYNSSKVFQRVLRLWNRYTSPKLFRCVLGEREVDMPKYGSATICSSPQLFLPG